MYNVSILQRSPCFFPHVPTGLKCVYGIKFRTKKKVFQYVRKKIIPFFGIGVVIEDTHNNKKNKKKVFAQGPLSLKFLGIEL